VSTLAESIAPPRRRRTRVTPGERIVVVGNGMVGWKLCQGLVARGVPAAATVTIFGEEPRPAYDRVHLTSLFGGKGAEELILSPREWYAENGLGLHTGDPVLAIDRGCRVVTTASGRTETYDTLVLATGSRPFVPPIHGVDTPGVFVYRTIEDVRAIRDYARQVRTAAVVGGGLLGLEAAQALLDLGLRVTVLERGPGLMTRQLTPKSAALLAEKVAALGVTVLFNRNTKAVAPVGGGLELTFDRHEPLACDLLVIAAGIKPRQELAEACGLVCDRRGGVVVDDRLTTSDPKILAIGECASHRSMVYGLVAPGYLMAEVAAERLAGGRATFTGAPLSARLKLLGVEVSALGEFQDPGDSLVHANHDVHRQLILRRGRLVGAIVVGPNPEIGRLQDAVERRRYVFPWRLGRFARTGLLWGAKAADPAEWPAGTVVCNCRGITRGALSEACRQGCRTIDELAQKTGASTVCGSCRPLLAQLAGTAGAAAAPVRGRGALLGICALGVAVAAAIAFMPPVIVGQSVEHAAPWEVLFTEPPVRRVTGFVVLGLTVASLLLSLRKRIRRLAWGNFGWWRVLHTALGLAGVAGLVAHTGFRLGENLNRVLMLNFLGLVLLGTCAGAVTALEAKLDVLAARRLRTFWTWAHIVMAWPLPVLLTFHVLSAYYF